MRRRLECHRGAVFFGKQVTIIVRSAPGSSYDATASLIARFMGTHLPGAPNMIVQNMPGAGSLTATNNLYNLAPEVATIVSWKSNAVKTTDVLFKTELWRMTSTCGSRSISPRSRRLRKRSSIS